MNEKITQKIINRQQANYEILNVLKEWIDNNQALRFGQILACANIVKYDYSDQTMSVIDPFFEESVDTLNAIKHPNK